MRSFRSKNDIKKLFSVGNTLYSVLKGKRPLKRSINDPKLPSKTDQYITALRAPRIDSSEFILLATGFLKSVTRGSQSALTNIENKFIHREIKEAINAILALVEDPKLELDSCVIELFKIKAATCVKYDDPLKNYSRRFFDTTYSQEVLHVLRAANHTELAPLMQSMEKLSQFIKDIPIDPPLDVKPKNTVTTIADIDFLMDRIHDLTETKNELSEYEHLIRKDSPHSKRKDRGAKKNNTTILSCAPGIVTASMPYPHQDWSLMPIEVNRVTDIFHINPTINKGYSGTYHEIPFVNSVSGHSFFLAGMLNKFLEKRKADYKNNSSDILRDFNNIIEVFIAHKINKGFHSLSEMVDVIKQPEILALFKKHSIDLKIEFKPALVGKAFERSVEYAIKSCHQRLVNLSVMLFHYKPAEQKEEMRQRAASPLKLSQYS